MLGIPSSLNFAVMGSVILTRRSWPTSNSADPPAARACHGRLPEARAAARQQPAPAEYPRFSPQCIVLSANGLRLDDASASSWTGLRRGAG
jgi:hypothetical protein